MKKHYVYRITNKVENKHYYGCRTTKLDPKDDLGSKYFSSAKDKEFIKDQKENPDHYKYKIIKIFSTREEAIKLEIKLHNKFNVGVNESFYNKVKQTSCKFDTSGVKMSNIRTYDMSESTKEKLRRANLGKKASKETKEKMSISQTGRIVSNETRRKIGDSNSKKIRTEEEKAHLSKVFTGKKMLKSTKLKISSALTGREKSSEHKHSLSLSKQGKSILLPKVCCILCKIIVSKNNFNKHKCISERNIYNSLNRTCCLLCKIEYKIKNKINKCKN